jgi:hypothetical protein
MSRTYRGSLTFSSNYEEVKDDPDYVYYNGDIINNGSQSNPTGVDAPDPFVRFTETRDQPIISDCSKYNFSIVRFSLNGPNMDLPIFIPQIRIGPVENPGNNLNLTVYDVGLSVTVTYTVGPSTQTTTLNQTQSVIWAPEVLDTTIAPLPATTTTQTGQDLSTRYYWCMTASHWVNLVNRAYINCWSNLNIQFGLWYVAQFGGVAPNLTTQPPRLTYNPTTNLFNIWADRYGFGDNQIAPVAPLTAQRTSAGSASDENFSMLMDANTFGMFANFDNLYLNQPNSFTYKILISNIGNLYNNIYNLASPPAPLAKSYWVMTQDCPSTSTLWCPVSSIVFTSGTLPLVFEATGEPVRFGTGNNNSIGGTTSAFAPIITDIQLTNTSCFDYRQFIQYVPSAEYRLASFQKSPVPISQIDIQIFYKNRLDGKLYPLQMYNLSSVSIKIMFRRRGVMDFPHPAKKDPMNF